MNAYRPISCADHERLEFAALKRQWLQLAVDTGNGPDLVRLLPLDVYTRDGAEWLRAQSGTGEVLTLRLDALRL